MISANNTRKSVPLNLCLPQIKQCQKWLDKIQTKLHFLIVRISCALKLTYLGLTLISLLLGPSEESPI
ncbi:unnamed protein product [Hymenolepis diminuta]|uniref:Uncharacterized protein n=1 Tax=Hymenolepis diminuta TaxID=6216 RepID=A0A564XYQ4_HYMDI|nr:unnamed protein product [Hymenolepis diminuta]VUZ42133.1 unnamed protein product [Hymenolepis diminuta]VUZ42137.1 unnamed protein product [Hymenolepis diminuta]VUZ57449.1 unnamed protein product [Hymenolepis diminuta]